jgi:hypothetical protein
MRAGIARDAAYVGKFVSDLANPKHASFAPIASFCMVPYISLFAHESYRKLEVSDPELASLLSEDVKSIMSRSRHSLKLFEDTSRGVEGLLTYFRDEILTAHKRRFLGNTWLPLARPLETDLGLFSYEGRLINTTHAANFHLGIEPSEFLEKTGPQTQAIYEEYGRYFARLGARLDSGGETFVSHLDPRRFNRHPDDVRADKYYRRVFDGAENPDINVLLTVFLGMMNFVDSIIVAGGDERDIDYTVFKIRFLTLYQVLSSLRVLREQQSQILANRSMAYIEEILNTGEVQLIIQPTAKPFRNALMHYGIDSRVDMQSLDIRQPLFGLVAVYFPSYDSAGLGLAVGHGIAKIASVLQEWSSA